MRPPRIIGLAGQAGVGKSVVAAAVSRRWGHEVNSFGANIKDVGEMILGINVPFLRLTRGLLKSGRPVEPGALARCVAIRQEFWRMSKHIDTLQPGCWTRSAMRFADSSLSDGKGLRDRDAVKCQDGLYRARVVFDDVRKVEEVDAIRDRAGAVVFLDGPSLWGASPGFDSRVTKAMCGELTVDVNQWAQEVAWARGNAQDWEAAERKMGDAVVDYFVRAFGWDDPPDVRRRSDHHTREEQNAADGHGPDAEPEDVPAHGLPLE